MDHLLLVVLTTPLSALAETSIFSSSTEWASSCRVAGFNPKTRSSNAAAPLRSQMAGMKMASAQAVGLATASAVASGLWSATDFGVSSPTTTTRKVISRKASAADRPCETAGLRPPGKTFRMGSSQCASAGSAIHPSPRLHRVMPSWVAATNSIRIFDGPFHPARGAHAALHELGDPCPADADQGELRCDEEGVAQDEQE